MQVQEPSQPIRVEPRWPAAIVILAVLLILKSSSSRVVLMPSWFGYAVVMAFLLPMAGVWLSGGSKLWLRVERTTSLVLSMIVEVVVLLTLFYLLSEMLVTPSEFSGRQLFVTSIGTWITNVATFSMAYWQIDCGGPESRGTYYEDSKPDWLFPQAGVPEKVPPDWRPTYIDYLFLSFTTATAFSPTDAVPLTARAQVLMMVESAVSLLTLIVVAARAINLLGS